MYQHVDRWTFMEAVRAHDRVSNFETDGWLALFEYLEEVEDCCGQELELDVIALCCDFTRFEDVADYNENYGTEYEDPVEIDELACLIDDGPAFICYAH